MAFNSAAKPGRKKRVPSATTKKKRFTTKQNILLDDVDTRKSESNSSTEVELVRTEKQVVEKALAFQADNLDALGRHEEAAEVRQRVPNESTVDHKDIQEGNPTETSKDSKKESSKKLISKLKIKEGEPEQVSELESPDNTKDTSVSQQNERKQVKEEKPVKQKTARTNKESKSSHGRRKAPVAANKTKNTEEVKVTVESPQLDKQSSEAKETFHSLVTTNGKVTVPAKLRSKTFKSISQPIFTTIIFGFMAWIFLSVIMFSLRIKIQNFRLNQAISILTESTLWVGITSIIIMIIGIMAVIEHNRQIKLQTTQIATVFNNRYGMHLNHIDVCDLVNDFRIPINIDNERTDIRLTTLRRGRDARLVYSGTGIELPLGNSLIKQ